MKVFNNPCGRGVLDILTTVTDRTGMPSALEAVFQKTTLQTCIVHLIRNSLDSASWDGSKKLTAMLQPVYAAVSAEAASAAVDAFEVGARIRRKFPAVMVA